MEVTIAFSWLVFITMIGIIYAPTQRQPECSVKGGGAECLLKNSRFEMDCIWVETDGYSVILRTLVETKYSRVNFGYDILCRLDLREVKQDAKFKVLMKGKKSEVFRYLPSTTIASTEIVIPADLVQSHDSINITENNSGETTSGCDSHRMSPFLSTPVLALKGTVVFLLIFLVASLLYNRYLRSKLNERIHKEQDSQASSQPCLRGCREHVYASVNNLSNNNRLSNTRDSTQDLSRPHLQRVPSQNSDDTYLVPVTSRDTMPAPPRALPPRPHKPSIRNIPDTDPKSPNIGYLEPSTPPYIEAGPADFRDWKKDLDNDSDTDTSVHAEFQEEYDSGSRTPKYRAKWLVRSCQFSSVPQIVQKDEPATRFETGTRNPEDERQSLPFPVTMETLPKAKQRLRTAEFYPFRVNGADTSAPIPPRKTAGRPKRLHRSNACLVGQRHDCPRKVHADCEDTFSETSQRNIIKQHSNSCKIGQNSVEQPKNSYRIYPARFTELGTSNLGVKNEPVNGRRSGSDPHFSRFRKCEVSHAEGNGPTMDGSRPHFSQSRKCEISYVDGYDSAIGGSSPHSSQCNINNSPVSERTRRFSKHSMSPFAESGHFLFDIGQI